MPTNTPFMPAALIASRAAYLASSRWMLPRLHGRGSFNSAQESCQAVLHMLKRCSNMTAITSSASGNGAYVRAS